MKQEAVAGKLTLEELRQSMDLELLKEKERSQEKQNVSSAVEKGLREDINRLEMLSSQLQVEISGLSSTLNKTDADLKECRSDLAALSTEKGRLDGSLQTLSNQLTIKNQVLKS
jgi:hypothetical protein